MHKPDRICLISFFQIVALHGIVYPFAGTIHETQTVPEQVAPLSDFLIVKYIKRKIVKGRIRATSFKTR
jgi:hypothetical protein